MSSWAPVMPYGCGRVCDHGKTGSCRHPEVLERGQPVPFDAARRPGQVCGPEAALMDFPGLHAPLPGQWAHCR